ncbi:hypothetical protein [Bosea minatitlanensis]|uniref:Lipoprotein n=1 Tax=Bosea minatitlanensis TaxID=128782 RepID=A0ABW0EZ97_9HYPH|nr:hypothetical protein [Bosea minatitlanensis]MCT4492640.1 hypothetical protein [Bosea minatitlanensis]
MKWTAWAMRILITTSASGCAWNSGDFCDVATPIRPSAPAAAVMDRADKAAIVKHNEYGARACGW